MAVQPLKTTAPVRVADLQETGKKAYTRPTLTDLGDLRQVTRGGTQSHAEGGGGNTSTHIG